MLIIVFGHAQQAGSGSQYGHRALNQAPSPSADAAAYPASDPAAYMYLGTGRAPGGADPGQGSRYGGPGGPAGGQVQPRVLASDSRASGQGHAYPGQGAAYLNGARGQASGEAPPGTLAGAWQPDSALGGAGFAGRAGHGTGYDAAQRMAYSGSEVGAAGESAMYNTEGPPQWQGIGQGWASGGEALGAAPRS